MNKILVYLQRLFPPTHGTKFDISVFIGVFAIPWVLSFFGEWITDLSISSRVSQGQLLITAICIQIPGSLLKQEALRLRLNASTIVKEKSQIIAWLIFLYWVFSFIAAGFSVRSLSNFNASVAMPLIFGLSLIGTVTISYVLFSNHRHHFKIKSLKSKNQERLADFLLIIAAMIFSYSIWVPMVVEVASGQGHIQREATRSILGLIAYIIVMFVPFMFFYIAPRILFFVEDLNQKFTWIRFILIYFFSIKEMFF